MNRILKCSHLTTIWRQCINSGSHEKDVENSSGKFERKMVGKFVEGRSLGAIGDLGGRGIAALRHRQLDNLFVRFFSASPIELIVVRQGSTHHIQGTRRRNTTCSFLLPRTLLECGEPVAVSSKCVCGDAQQKMKALDRTRPRRETQKSAARGEGRRGSAGLDE